jgi:hypothetical protein
VYWAVDIPVDNLGDKNESDALLCALPKLPVLDLYALSRQCGLRESLVFHVKQRDSRTPELKTTAICLFRLIILAVSCLDSINLGSRVTSNASDFGHTNSETGDAAWGTHPCDQILKSLLVQKPVDNGVDKLWGKADALLINHAGTEASIR